MTIDSLTSPDPTENRLTGTVGGRPEAGSTYFLATGSHRINGYRFVWGEPLPDKEGKHLFDRGEAVKGAENLRDELGNRLPVPKLRHVTAFDKGEVDVSDANGVHSEGASTITDSQAGEKVTTNEAHKPAARARK